MIQKTLKNIGQLKYGSACPILLAATAESASIGILTRAVQNSLLSDFHVSHAFGHLIY